MHVLKLALGPWPLIIVCQHCQMSVSRHKSRLGNPHAADWYRSGLGFDRAALEKSLAGLQQLVVSVVYSYLAVTQTLKCHVKKLRVCLGLRQTHFWATVPRPQLRGLDRFWPSYSERRGLRHGKDGRYCVLYIVYKGVPTVGARRGNCQLLFFGNVASVKTRVEEVVPHHKSYAVYPNMFAVSRPIF
jgi:hypothetical protein